jgi:hypothetical protein
MQCEYWHLIWGTATWHFVYLWFWRQSPSVKRDSPISWVYTSKSTQCLYSLLFLCTEYVCWNTNLCLLSLIKVRVCILFIFLIFYSLNLYFDKLLVHDGWDIATRSKVIMAHLRNTALETERGQMHDVIFHLWMTLQTQVSRWAPICLPLPTLGLWGIIYTRPPVFSHPYSHDFIRWFPMDLIVPPKKNKVKIVKDGASYQPNAYQIIKPTHKVYWKGQTT